MFGSCCACCGEARSAFLTLDHIHRNGTKHRALFTHHDQMMRSIQREGWPKDKYRLLCMSCNFATRFGETCPHVETQVNEMLAGVFCS